MNERIRELIKSLGIIPEDEHYEVAELIVRECIRTIQMGISRDGHNTERYLRSMKHIKEIKQHFGVEE